MQIFLDTANVDEIREAARMGILDGVTTNPTLIAKEKKSFRKAISDIAELCQGPISAECVSKTAQDIVKEGRDLATIGKNIVVKIPITKEGLKATKILSSEGIKVNMTLCFSALQGLFAAKAGASFVSPFVGRVDDIGYSGIDIVRDIKNIYRNYGYNTKIIVASIRGVSAVLEAARCGADICTIPFSIFEKLIQHPLTDIGVKRFEDDFKKIPK